MSAKNLDNHGRWRSKTIAFRVSPEEDAKIEAAVRLSGLTKQDYITAKLLDRTVVVQGNCKVHRAVIDQLRGVLDELIRIENGANIDGELMEDIALITGLIDGLYEKIQTASVKLSWSHYCELLSISDIDKRSFYEKEAINSNWSVRELKRQIESSLFERLLLSRGDANKEQVLAFALHGNEIAQPADIIRDPYVFEFLGLPENKPVMESDLEQALVRQIEKFLLELGRGFMFVGTQ